MSKAADNDGGEATNASIVSNLTVSETETQYQDDFEADASPAKQASSSNLQRIPSQSLGASKPEQAEQLSHSNGFPSPARRDAVAETPEAAAKPGVPLSLQSPPPARQPPVATADLPSDDKVEDTATAVVTTQPVDVEPDATLPAAGDTVISPEKRKERDEAAAAAAAAKAIVYGRLAKPRVQSKTKVQVDEEKRLEAEREAAKLQRRLLKLKTEGPPERIKELGEPRVVKVDPRAGRPPPEIEEAQRLANLRFKETVKRRQREFDLVLEQEQHRLFHRFQEYAASKGTVLEETATTEPAAEPHASSHNDHDADAADVLDEAEIDAIVLALTTGHLTNMLPPGREAPPPPPAVPDRDGTLTKHKKKRTKKGRASSVEPTTAADETTSPHTTEAESPSPKSKAAGAASPLASSPTSPGGDGNDDGVSIAGHVSHNPTSTTRHTFRPASWKQHLSPEVREELFPAMVEKTPSPSAQLPSVRQQGTIQRTQQPQQKAHASTPTPSQHVPFAGSSGSRPGGAVSNATPEPVIRATATHGTTGSTQIKRTACVGAGGLTVIDGAVSDFLLGDGEVKRTRVPTLYRRKVQLQGHNPAHR
jgi:hypothetical protein